MILSRPKITPNQTFNREIDDEKKKVMLYKEEHLMENENFCNVNKFKLVNARRRVSAGCLFYGRACKRYYNVMIKTLYMTKNY